jgi:hypothetical protein
VLSVRGSRELKAVALALKAARRDVRNDINKATRATLGPVWKAEIANRARTSLDRKVLAQGARIAAGNPPTLVAATSTRRLKGGLIPVESWHAVEFGADRAAVTTYTRASVKGNSHKVTRHTRRQLPPRYRKGRVVFPAAAELAARATALWVQLVVRVFNEAVEKGAR